MRLLTPLLVVLAVFVSATIPAGWMPKSLDDGQLVLVICTGTEMVELIVDEAGNPLPLHEQVDDERSPCAFSAQAAVAPALSGPFELPLSSLLSARWSDQSFTHESAGFHRRYDARGPPLFS